VASPPPVDIDTAEEEAISEIEVDELEKLWKDLQRLSRPQKGDRPRRQRTKALSREILKDFGRAGPKALHLRRQAEDEITETTSESEMELIVAKLRDALPTEDKWLADEPLMPTKYREMLESMEQHDSVLSVVREAEGKIQATIDQSGKTLHDMPFEVVRDICQVKMARIMLEEDYVDFMDGLRTQQPDEWRQLCTANKALLAEGHNQKLREMKQYFGALTRDPNVPAEQRQDAANKLAGLQKYYTELDENTFDLEAHIRGDWLVEMRDRLAVERELYEDPKRAQLDYSWMKVEPKPQEGIHEFIAAINTTQAMLDATTKIVKSKELDWEDHPDQRTDFLAAAKDPFIRQDLLFDYPVPEDMGDYRSTDYILNKLRTLGGRKRVEEMDEAEREELITTEMREAGMNVDILSENRTIAKTEEEIDANLKAMLAEEEAIRMLRNMGHQVVQGADGNVEVVPRPDKRPSNEYLSEDYKDDPDVQRARGELLIDWFDGVTPSTSKPGEPMDPAEVLTPGYFAGFGMPSLADMDTGESGDMFRKELNVPRVDRRLRSSKSAEGLKPDEVNAGFTYDEFDEAYMKEFDRYVGFSKRPLRPGMFVQGEIVKVTDRQAFVDVGMQQLATLPRSDVVMDPTDKTRLKQILKPGQKIEAEIKIIDDKSLVLTMANLQYFNAWEKLVEIQANDLTIDAMVLAVPNTAGVQVSVLGVQAWLPSSQMCPPGVEPTEEMIGKQLRVKVLDLDIANDRLVVSQKRAEVEEQLKNLSRGDLIEGVVESIQPFGAFIAFGCTNALLHVSQISYQRVDEVPLPIGTKVKAMVIDYDKVTGRVSLSTKVLEKEPGQMLRNYTEVFEEAEETARLYHDRMVAEQKAREEAARELIASLGLNESILNVDFNEGAPSFGEQPAAPPPPPTQEGQSTEGAAPTRATIEDYSPESGRWCAQRGSDWVEMDEEQDAMIKDLYDKGESRFREDDDEWEVDWGKLVCTRLSDGGSFRIKPPTSS